MNYILPPTDQNKTLNTDWFPTPAQCVIFRNLGYVPTKNIADALNTDEKTILQMAGDMGLDTACEPDGKWLTRGYITIIRNNWHLLNYEQICRLLGWNEEYLAFILKEDDFLDVKLGNFKPGVPDTAVRELTDAEKVRTCEIRDIMLKLRGELPEATVLPFDFFPAEDEPDKKSFQDGDSLFKYRIIYSYCSLYGDTFLDKQLIDVSFPETMLARYQASGINGVWTQAVLSAVAPYPFGNYSEELMQKRLEGIRYLTDKLEAYGIRLYLYINEPRALPDTFFPKKYEHIKGTVGTGLTCLCVNTEGVQNYLRDSIAFLVRNAPKLGGFFTITASENRTNCYSHIKRIPCNCPRCKDKTPEEIYGLVNRLIAEGAHSANPDIKIFAYTWGWEAPEQAQTVADAMPKDVGLLCVSENRVEKNIRGTETKVIDYSISVDGPGRNALENWKYAHLQGRDSIAKVQVNNTWELSTVPFIPVFDKIYNHIRKIAETGDVNGLLLSWTLGGYPSPILDMIGMFCQEGDRIPSREEVYKTVFAGADTEKLSKAFSAFSDAFNEYPFSMQTAYKGPQHMGAANLLYTEKTGFKATMVCFPYDDLDGWRNIFPADTFYGAFDSLCRKWQKGLEILGTVDLSSSPKLPMVADCAEAAYLHFLSVRNQIRFYMEGTAISEKRDILISEENIAVKMLKLTAHNATIGYEASNHYFYTGRSLAEKILNVRSIAENLAHQ